MNSDAIENPIGEIPDSPPQFDEIRIKRKGGTEASCVEESSKRQIQVFNPKMKMSYQRSTHSNLFNSDHYQGMSQQQQQKLRAMAMMSITSDAKKKPTSLKAGVNQTSPSNTQSTYQFNSSISKINDLR